MSTRYSWGWLFLHARRFHSSCHIWAVHECAYFCAGDLFKIEVVSEIVLEAIQVDPHEEYPQIFLLSWTRADIFRHDAYECFPHSVQHICILWWCFRWICCTWIAFIYWKLVLKKINDNLVHMQEFVVKNEKDVFSLTYHKQKNLFLLMKLK